MQVNKPADIPKSGIGRLPSHRAVSGERQQPHYLTYLEKTLEKSDLTIQTVKQMGAQIKHLEQKVEVLQTNSNYEYLYNKLQQVDELQVNLNEESGLNKMILEAMQSKIKDQDIILETIVKQLNSQ